MDLAILEKKSILIPTPGQTEQEYLARYLQKTGFAYTVDQANFSLENTLQKAGAFPYSFYPDLGKNKLKDAIMEFVNTSLEFSV